MKKERLGKMVRGALPGLDILIMRRHRKLKCQLTTSHFLHQDSLLRDCHHTYKVKFRFYQIWWEKSTSTNADSKIVEPKVCVTEWNPSDWVQCLLTRQLMAWRLSASYLQFQEELALTKPEEFLNPLPAGLSILQPNQTESSFKNFKQKWEDTERCTYTVQQTGRGDSL